MERYYGTTGVPSARIRRENNWYADVGIIPKQDEIVSDKEYRIEKVNCGGKDGQNVDIVELCVQIIYIPTSLVSLSIEERSQF